MGFADSVKSKLRFNPDPVVDVPGQIHDVASVADRPVTADNDPDEKHTGETHEPAVEAAVATIEAAQAIWGKTGRWLIIAGLAMVMIIYEIDNSTVYVYNNYSTSSFNALSELATLSTASTILFAVVKPPIAKISNIIGRGQTYMMTITFYIIGYILMASAKNIGTYAGGIVFYAIGQSGTNLMNDVTIGDITTARWRGFGIGVSFFPYLITPWISAYIVNSVVSPNGIGWRWGIGMFAILMPFCASFIITTLTYYQHRAKKMGIAPRVRMSLYEFCSQIDLGGTFLFSGGLAMLLIPLTLAATSPQKWQTPYLDVLISLGGALLIVLPFYEKYFAKHPIVPIHYFKSMTIVMCVILIATDSLGFSCTHTYIYSWGSVARNLPATVDTFYIYTNGVVQCFFGIIAGLIMMKTRRYKYLIIAGAIIRTIGYGVMIRLRGEHNSRAELFIVQAVQGVGSGILQGALLVPAQISVPHSQMAQITALVICMSFVGSSVGACIAGGIYTNTFKPALHRHLGANANSTLIDSLFNSITGEVPLWGTPERDAVNLAFTDVLRYMTYTALGSSVPALFLAWLIPNHELPDRNNLVE